MTTRYAVGVRVLVWMTEGNMVAEQVIVREDIAYEQRYLQVKRLIDIVLTSLAVICLSPLLFAIAIIIKLDSPGPILFRQKRIGLGGKEFTFYKFRSMYAQIDTTVHVQAIDTWMNGTGVLNLADPDKPFKLGDDSRITRIGKFIRKSSIDELPQLWNVLKGDMSIVGPRPPLDYEVSRYTARHWLRLTGKPGLTGTWQVFGRGRATFEEMIDQDLEYLGTQSVVYDVKLMFLTVPVVLTGRGGA